MALNGINELETVAILFALSGLFVLLALRFILRTPPLPEESAQLPQLRACLPQRLEAVLEEGFEVLELYDDTVPVVSQLGEMTGYMAETVSVERTAKVRDPETGAVALLRVVTSSRASR